MTPGFVSCYLNGPLLYVTNKPLIKNVSKYRVALFPVFKEHSAADLDIRQMLKPSRDDSFRQLQASDLRR